MAHQLHLEKEKYRQWVKAGLGLGYLKEGLAPFCDDIAKQQHKDILDCIQRTKTLSTVTCGQCALRTLKPDHVKVGKDQCPFGQDKCNCCYTSGKSACPNRVCGAIYDTIITNHASTPPAPNWKNTQTQQWTVDPWSIAKGFINAPGYEQKMSANDTDCTGLLHVIINNTYFHNHIGCNLAGVNVYSKVRQYRNEIFHSSTMELEEAKANSYIDDMIAVLKDGKKLINRTDAQDAVKKLEKLKNEEFIITTETMEKVLGDIREEIRKSTEGLATKDDFEDLNRKFDALESFMAELAKEINILKADKSEQEEKRQSDYENSKLELQETLLSHYRTSVLQVSAIPLKPERNHCDFSEVYIRPRMTYDTQDEYRKPVEKEIQSLSEFFMKSGNRMKSVYVLGDAGSGKSSFCKSLVNYWCMVHSREPINEDEFDGIKEMKKFEFLFYIDLRRFKDIVSIKEMLSKQYKHEEILTQLLKQESRTIVIVLDGLDEWSCKGSTSDQFQTEGLPERDIWNNYTVITTSRPWKIETLRITDQEIDLKVNLKGFDKSSVTTMIDKTVPILNDKFGGNKSPSDCKDKLNNKAIASMTEVPIMLLQLICLWFDDKLQVSSRCAVFSAMLELFFSWNDKKKKREEEHKEKKAEEHLFGDIEEKSKYLPNVELPKYLINNKLCKKYKYLIYELSRLAYETLFSSEKEASLTFENSVLERLEISKEVKKCSLKLGILSEEEFPSSYASTCDSSLLSFVHKSVQEYLAAVYVSIEFKSEDGTSLDSKHSDFPGHRVPLIKSNCKTVNDILEQANVFILLCGLQPQIATSVLKYLYDIVTEDERVQEYRRTIDNRHMRLILQIQECILKYKEEIQWCQTNILSSFGDIIIRSKSDSDDLCTAFDKQYISADSVRSFRVDKFAWEMTQLSFNICLRKCRRLESIYVLGLHIRIDQEDIKSICGLIEDNTKTLKSLGSERDPILCKTIVDNLPNMDHLVALHINGVTMPHENITSLCTFLSSNSHLEQISIIGVCCKSGTYRVRREINTNYADGTFRKYYSYRMISTDSESSTDSMVNTDSELDKCKNQHEVDLSEHQQLQCLRYDRSITVTRFNTSNIEKFVYSSLYSRQCVKVFETLCKAHKLTQLELNYRDDIAQTVSTGNSLSYHTVTEKLISVLPILHQLRELFLQYFTLTDNIIKCPSEMKSMMIIELVFIKMSLTTWRQFVDSLPKMPLPVKVETSKVCITRNGEECNPDIEWLGGEEAAAWQHVRKQVKLTILEAHETPRSCRFSTKK